MADISIINFSAVDHAITEFRTCSTQIGSIASNLQSNAGALKSAWTASASDAYAGKMSKLVENFNSAQNKLNKEVQELQEAYDRQDQAEQTAQQLADSVNSIQL